MNGETQGYAPNILPTETAAACLLTKVRAAYEKYLEDPTVKNERTYGFALLSWAKVTGNTQARLHARTLLDGSELEHE